MKAIVFNGNEPVVNRDADRHDNTFNLKGNEVDEIVARSIADRSLLEDDKELELHRSKVLNCFKEFHLRHESEPLQTAQNLDKAWKDAELNLSNAQFSYLKEIINKDIETIVSGQSTSH